MQRILIIEDDTTFSHILCKYLEKQTFQVNALAKISEAIGAISSEPYDLMLLDYRLPDGTALDLLGSYEFQNSRIPVIIMTTFNDIRTAVKMVRMGALDYITKPVNPEELLMSIQEALKKEKDFSGLGCNNKWIRGQSDVSRRMYNYLELVAPTDISVLIQGESGTGKEHVARSIHQSSTRADKPFVALDCGALTQELAASELFGHTKGAFTSAIQDRRGHFEAANGGTLFMDEIGNLSYENQVKLLRAIEEKSIQPIGSNSVKKVDVRIIAATNDDLFLKVNNKEFREDLYHRINEFNIDVPALRERKEDIELFIRHFVLEANETLNKEVSGFSQKVMDIFYQYTWPGNLRELKNVVKRSVLLAQGTMAGAETLPKEMLLALEESTIRAPAIHNPLRDSTETDLKALQAINEKTLIIRTLEKVRHNKSKAAKLLNIDRKTLYNKLSRYDIEHEHYTTGERRDG